MVYYGSMAKEYFSSWSLPNNFVKSLEETQRESFRKLGEEKTYDWENNPFSSVNLLCHAGYKVGIEYQDPQDSSIFRYQNKEGIVLVEDRDGIRYEFKLVLPLRGYYYSRMNEGSYQKWVDFHYGNFGLRVVERAQISLGGIAVPLPSNADLLFEVMTKNSPVQNRLYPEVEKLLYSLSNEQREMLWMLSLSGGQDVRSYNLTQLFCLPVGLGLYSYYHEIGHARHPNELLSLNESYKRMKEGKLDKNVYDQIDVKARWIAEIKAFEEGLRLSEEYLRQIGLEDISHKMAGFRFFGLCNLYFEYQRHCEIIGRAPEELPSEYCDEQIFCLIRGYWKVKEGIRKAQEELSKQW